MFGIIAGLIALAVIVIVILALRQPDEFAVTRQAVIHAPPSRVFPEINNLQNWNGWSPWARLDPGARYAFSGPHEGTGAHFAWDGNRHVGAGHMTIIDSIPDQLVQMKLVFLKPMKATNIVDFTLAPQGENTVVTWSMRGPSNFAGKMISVFMDCEKMTGGFFEQGLANLDARVQGRSS